MKLYTIDSDYIKYLRSFEPRIWDNKEKIHLRPYIGVVLYVGVHQFYAPLSSAKEKHFDMKNRIDLIKIEDKGTLKAIINLNNMIPVTNSLVKIIDLNSISDKTYKTLLNAEIRDIYAKEEIILKKAILVYNKVTKHYDEPHNKNLVSRSYNFKFLEEKRREYCEQNNLGGICYAGS